MLLWTVLCCILLLAGRHDPAVPRPKRMLSDKGSNVLVSEVQEQRQCRVSCSSAGMPAGQLLSTRCGIRWDLLRGMERRQQRRCKLFFIFQAAPFANTQHSA
jgi:hypothetical protein